MIIGIFGGTFDPPHLGHLGLAQNALKSKLVDQVWFVPCVSHRFGKEPVSYDHRLEMCRLMVEDDPNIWVCDIERTLECPGYTYYLVKALQAAHKEHQFRLLAGADIFFERQKWHRYDDIVKLAPPIYVARKGIKEIPGPTLSAPMEVSSTALREALERGQRPYNLMSANVINYLESLMLYKRTK